MTADPQLIEREERVRTRAYEIWERAGRPDGKELEQWLQAEQEEAAAEAPES